MSSLLQIAGFSCVQTAFPQPFSQCLPLRLCSGFSCAQHHVSVMLSAVFASAAHTVSPVIRLSVHETSPQCLPSHFLKHLHYMACRRQRGLGKVLVLSYECY